MIRVTMSSHGYALGVCKDCGATGLQRTSMNLCALSIHRDDLAGPDQIFISSKATVGIVNEPHKKAQARYP